jgi:hypothetical protein
MIILEIGRFNETEHDFKNIKQWVTRITKLTPSPIPEEFNPKDYVEPVPTELVHKTDFGLILAIVSLTTVMTARISPKIFRRFGFLN